MGWCLRLNKKDKASWASVCTVLCLLTVDRYSVSSCLMLVLPPCLPCRDRVSPFRLRAQIYPSFLNLLLSTILSQQWKKITNTGGDNDAFWWTARRQVGRKVMWHTVLFLHFKVGGSPSLKHSFQFEASQLKRHLRNWAPVPISHVSRNRSENSLIIRQPLDTALLCNS